MPATLSSVPSPSLSASPTRWWVIALCTVVMMVEGFDLLIYSNAIPSLLMDRGMGIDRAGAGNIGSMIFIGMLLGGVAAGRCTQAWGLTRVMGYGFTLFTLATALAAWSQNGWQLGLLRFLAGLGLGVVLPASLSFARQHCHERHGALAISIVMSGIPLGGMLAAVVSQHLIPSWGWRSLFVVGGVLGVLMLALMLPAMARLEAQAAAAAGAALKAPRRQDWRAILRGASLGLLLLGTLATLADLLAWYGVAVWLTQLMREFEVPFNGAMQLMFTLNIGAIVGSLCTARLAMRWGTRPVAIAAGVLAALCLCAIASRQFAGASLFVWIALLGMSTISAQNLVNALVADAYPAAFRAAAIGITLGLGRVGAVIAPSLGGYILSAGHGPSWVLLAFACAAVAGALILLAFTPARRQRAQAQLASQTQT